VLLFVALHALGGVLNCRLAGIYLESIQQTLFNLCLHCRESVMDLGVVDVELVVRSCRLRRMKRRAAERKRNPVCATATLTKHMSLQSTQPVYIVGKPPLSTSQSSTPLK
jgi:hypothetical protein